MLESFSVHLVRLPRHLKQTLFFLLDTVLLGFSAWASYTLRFGTWFVPSDHELGIILAAPLITASVFAKLGLYRSVIRYLGEQVIWSIVKGISIALLLWTTVFINLGWLDLIRAPLEVPILYGLLGSVLVVGSRFAFRWILWLPIHEKFQGRRVLIFGADETGRQLLASLREGGRLLPVGFLDHDIRLHGTEVAGLHVYPAKQLGRLIERFGIQEVIVTQPSLTGTQRRGLMSQLEQYPVRIRILPPLADFTKGGRHLENMVREIDIGDLLGRESIKADPTLLGHCISGKNILVTGAGGSIGQELCQQIAMHTPATLVLLEANEYALYQVDRIMSRLLDSGLVSCLGSVENAALVSEILSIYKINTIYHAAAHKHVPLVEVNVLEGVRNNVLGTLTLMDQAYRAGVETIVQISTDKAVRTTNVMGATKRWAELIVQHYAQRALQEKTGQHFCAVRFGNVLGSSGSVIPLFKEQIAHGGPVTVTHPEVTRFFMSIHEAVALVIQAGSMSEGGEIFLLDMGEPVRIIDLAKNLIRLAGHTVRTAETPSGDIEISYIGLRPGEKLQEDLLMADTNICGTRHPQIMQVDESVLPHLDLERAIQELLQSLDSRNIDKTKALLMRLANPLDTTYSDEANFHSSGIIIPFPNDLEHQRAIESR